MLLALDEGFDHDEIHKRNRRSLAHKLLTVTSIPLSRRSCLRKPARSKSTALANNPLSGSLTITHPFHPFFGKRFKILKSKCISGIEAIVVEHKERGSFAVPCDWTNLKEPEISDFPRKTPPILSFGHLLDFANLLENIKQKKEVDK